MATKILADKPLCRISDCNSEIRSKKLQLCNAHALRMERHSSTDTIRTLSPLVPCTAPNCEQLGRYPKQNPLCAKHTRRLQHYGTLELACDSLSGVFWKHVNKNGPLQPHMQTPCWLWEGTRTVYGYGQVVFQKKTYRAHRVSYFLHNGAWPQNLGTHDCDFKLCVNPDHLKDGTPAQNMREASERGLSPIGSRAGGSKLTEADVVRIKQMLEQGCRCEDIGKQFNVTRSCIQAIKRNVNWKHVVLE